MTIAFIIDNFPKLSETFILNQITGLIDLGHDVKIFAKNNPKEKQVHPEVEKYNLLQKTTYLDIPENKTKRFFKGITLFPYYAIKSPLIIFKTINLGKYFKESLSLYYFFLALPFLDKKFDVALCHYGPNGTIGNMLKHLGICKQSVVMFHGYGIREGLRNPGMYKQMFADVDLILSISKYNHDNLIKLGADPQKIVDHPVGIDLSKFPSKANFYNQNHKIKLITVARLHPDKELSLALKSVSKLRSDTKANLEYEIIGDGPERKKLEHLSKSLELNQIVKFTGYKTQPELIKALRSSDLFLLTSKSEALPVVLMEAAASNLPIISTNVGSIKELVINKKTGYLIDQDKPELIAEKIEYLYNHPDLIQQMGEQGRESISNRYNIDILNKQLSDRLSSLLN